MDSEKEKCEEIEKAAKKRRSSILKTPKVRNPFGDIDITETYSDMNLSRPVRRVSFASSNFVKPFVADPEQNTIWDTTYEEDVHHTNSTQSSQEQTNSTRFRSTLFNSTSSAMASNATSLCMQDMELTEVVSFVGKENIPICPSNVISIVDFAKTKRAPGTIIPVFDLPLNVQTPVFENSGLGNVTQGMEFTCQNLVPLMTSDKNHLNHTIHRETHMELTEISLHETEKIADASAMEFTCQMPKNVTNVSQGDMEFTCQVPQGLVTRTNCEDEEPTRADDNMEFTCQASKTNVTRGSEDMELTRPGTRNLSRASHMQFTCQGPYNILPDENGSESSAQSSLQCSSPMDVHMVTIDASRISTTLPSAPVSNSAPPIDPKDNSQIINPKNKGNIFDISRKCVAKDLSETKDDLSMELDSGCSSTKNPILSQSAMADMSLSQIKSVSTGEGQTKDDLSTTGMEIDSECNSTRNLILSQTSTTVNLSEIKSLNRVALGDVSQRKDVLSEAAVQHENVNMNSLRVKCGNQVSVADLNQTKSVLSKTAMDDANYVTNNEKKNVTMNSERNTVRKVTEVTQTQDNSSTKSQSAMLANDETINKSMNFSQIKSVSKGGETKDDLSNTGMEVDGTRNSILSQRSIITNNENKNMTMNLSEIKSLNRVALGDVSQRKVVLSKAAVQDENVNMNTLRIKCVNQVSVVDENQTKSVLSNTAMAMDDANYSALHRSLGVTNNEKKNVTMNSERNTVRNVTEVTQTKDNLSTKNLISSQSAMMANDEIINQSMNFSQIKSVSKGGQTKDDLSNIGMEVDSTRNSILSQRSIITNNENKNMTMNLSEIRSLNRVALGDASQRKVVLSKAAVQDENVNMNSLRVKCVNQVSVVDENQTKSVLSKTAMAIDDANYSALHRSLGVTNNEKKNVTMNSERNTVRKVTEVNQTQDNSSTKSQSAMLANDETINKSMDFSQIKSVSKSGQTKDDLSNTDMEVDSTRNSIFSQRSIITNNENKNMTMNLSEIKFLNRVTLGNVSQRRVALSEAAVQDENVNMNSLRVKCVNQVSVVDENQSKSVLSKTAMEMDNTRHSTLNVTNSENTNVTMNSERNIARKVDVMEVTQTKDALSMISMEIESAANLALTMSASEKKDLKKTENDNSKTAKEMNNPRNVTFCEMSKIRMDDNESNKAKDKLSKTATEIDSTKDFTLSHSLSVTSSENKNVTMNSSQTKFLSKAGVENKDVSSMSNLTLRIPEASKIEDDFEHHQKDLVQRAPKEEINDTHRLSKSPKISSIPVRANSTLLNTPERLSRFKFEKDESALDLMVPCPIEDTSLEPTVTLKPHLNPPRSLEPSFHFNLTNLSSGIDDTQQLLKCTYSNSMKEAIEVPKVDDNLEDLKDSPDISSCDVLQDRKLAHINDTYVLKGKQAKEESDEEDVSLGIISNDRIDMSSSLLEAAPSSVKATAVVKYDLKHVPLRIKRVSEIADLLEKVKRQRVEITNLLENVKFRPMRVPRELAIYENSASDNSESVDDTTEEVISCPSVEDKIKKHQESCQNCWKLEKVEDQIYHFSTFFGALVFTLQIYLETGNVYDIQTANRLSETAKPLAQFCVKIFLDRFNHNVIRAAIGDRYDIVSFLDYVQMSMLRINEFIMGFMALPRLATMQKDFVAKYQVINVPLVLSFEILVDVSDLENLQFEKDVTILTKIGKVNEKEIKNLAENCPKGLEFFPKFAQNLQEYLKLKERRKCFGRTYNR